MRYKVIIYTDDYKYCDETAEIISSDIAIQFIRAYENIAKSAQQAHARELESSVVIEATEPDK